MWQALAQLALPLLGGILSAQPSKSNFQDPTKQLRELYEFYSARMMPALSGQVSAGIGSGNALSQQLQHSLGSSQGLSSGIGRFNSAAGATFGGIKGAQAEADFREQISRLTNQGFDSLMRARPDGILQRPKTRSENFQAYLGDLLSNPGAMGALGGLFQGGKTRPGGGQT